MAETYVTGETLVGEIVTQYPEAIDVLLSIGMHCLGCALASAETLEQACLAHGVDPDGFIEELRAYLESL